MESKFCIGLTMKGLCTLCILLCLPVMCEPQVGLKISSFFPKTETSLHTKDYETSVKQHSPKESGDKASSHIRIRPFYFLSKHLLPEERLALQNVLQKAISKAESLLSVIERTDGQLLLKRKEACPIVRKSGINKGRCSRIKKGYNGERCLDNFRIPSDHLEGYAVYDKTNPEPAKVYKMDGAGVADADFVLYVTSKTTSLCDPHKSSAIAYAATCQLGHHGRPTAGQVNFCPRNLKAQKFDGEMMYKTAIHELFHALGFSGKLFDKFVNCDKNGECHHRQKPVVETSSGALRLITPAVMREMRNHFGCDTSKDFGGPLHSVEGKLSSHWDPVLMHSSIMTAKEQKPYTSLIDRITLAVFEDSGWYRVNYSQADPFIWGKDKGCEFILGNDCSEEDGFCSGNVNGCHHLRLSKAKCTGNLRKDVGQCGVFAADQKPCFVNAMDGSSTEDETFSSQSRCFLSSLVPIKTSQESKVPKAREITGRCYESKCDGNSVYLRVQRGDWILCPPSSTVKIDKFDGFITCPPAQEICASFNMKHLQSPSIADLPMKITEKSYSAALSDEAPEEEQRRHLYAQIKISKRLSDNETEELKTALYKVVTDNKILFNEVSTLSSHDSVRICLTLEFKPDNKLKRQALRKFFIKAVSDKFNRKYDSKAAISVLTSSKYFCKENYFGKKRPYWAYPRNKVRGENTAALLLQAVILGLVSLLISAKI